MWQKWIFSAILQLVGIDKCWQDCKLFTTTYQFLQSRINYENTT